jgi:hypothetical protein
MPVIDTDSGLLRDSAQACLHATEQAMIHVDAEIVGLIPELMDTLRDEGPYGYTLINEVHPDGSVKLPILTTADEIRDIYTLIRGASDLLKVEPLIEKRGSWYAFHEAISTGQIKNADLPPRETVTLALFPVSTGKGITGELVWIVRPRSELGAGVDPADISTDPVELRRDTLNMHEREVQAFRDNDLDALLDTFNDGGASAVRNYVNDTGALASLTGKEEHRAHYGAFFDKYTVESVDLLDRVVQETYAFAELRFTVTARDGSGTFNFHTAEFHAPASDGRFIARIGHGTDVR